MSTYEAPVEDHVFLLHDVLEVERSGLPGLSSLDREQSRAVLEGAGVFFAEVLQPLNASGDREGARLEDGAVRTPAGFPEAYRSYCAAGWHAAGLAEAFGGLGLPPVLGGVVNEYGSSANHAFMMYCSFGASAARVIAQIGPRWMAEHVAPQLAAGAWTATMAMTEPGCGTDLKLMRTRAAQDADGTWRISGTKMFISGGDHDLAENIVHCLLAKLPDGDGRYADDLSQVQLFIVPKRLVDPATGDLLGRNGVSVGSIEKKMGLHANATCALNLDGAIGYPIRPQDPAEGGKLGGMAGMFEIMTDARLMTAHNAIGLAEGAYQAASRYAKDRRAGRAPGRAPSSTADPILDQPDVRRLLLSARAFVEGARAVTAWAGLQMSRAAHAPSAPERQRAEDLLRLLTPVMKAYFSDKASESISACLQVLGGHGYIKDHPLEQFLRDARALQLYEGANGVQASDLVLRHLPQAGGRAAGAMLDEMRRYLAESPPEALPELRAMLSELVDHLQEAVDWAQANDGDVATRAAAAYDLLTLFGVAVVGFLWVRMAEAARRIPESPLARRKPVLARIWLEREAPLARTLLARIRSGPGAIMTLEPELF